MRRAARRFTARLPVPAPHECQHKGRLAALERLPCLAPRWDPAESTRRGKLPQPGRRRSVRQSVRRSATRSDTRNVTRNVTGGGAEGGSQAAPTWGFQVLSKPRHPPALTSDGPTPRKPSLPKSIFTRPRVGRRLLLRPASTAAPLPIEDGAAPLRLMVVGRHDWEPWKILPARRGIPAPNPRTAGSATAQHKTKADLIEQLT